MPEVHGRPEDSFQDGTAVRNQVPGPLSISYNKKFSTLRYGGMIIRKKFVLENLLVIFLNTYLGFKSEPGI